MRSINATPLDNPMMVLDLLYDDHWEYRVDRALKAWPQSDHAYVRLQFEYSVKDYEVTRRVVEELKVRRLVEGKKHWGYTDEYDLSISEEGRERVREFYAESGQPYNDSFSRRLRVERWLAASA